MATASDEYNTLRAELLEHQRSRMPILSLALTASATLFAASVSAQFGSPYLPLFALVLLSSARVQITQTQYGAQRIASYIRVVLEQEGKNQDLHWETGSIEIRRSSISKRKQIWNISPVTSIEWILLLSSLVAIGLAILLSLGLINGQGLTRWPHSLSFYISVGSAIVWMVFWVRYNKKVAEVQSMEADDKEAEFWREFKSSHGIFKNK
jgi:glucan phosphoethanolaminetransferase (alkaline phosphatase superfamily)